MHWDNGTPRRRVANRCPCIKYRTIKNDPISLRVKSNNVEILAIETELNMYL